MKWSEELGPRLLTKDGLQDTDQKLSGKKVVGLYFSAHWCPPCRQFTPFLNKVYEEMIVQHPEFELVFMSSDREPAAFAQYYGEMSFLALPYEERSTLQAISSKHSVKGIPMLIFLDEEGRLLTSDGRSLVADSSGDVNKLWDELTK